MQDERAARPTLFLQNGQEHHPLRFLPTLLYMGLGGFTGATVAYFMFAILLGAGPLGWLNPGAYAAFLEHFPSLALPFVFLGSITGFVGILAQSGRTKAASGTAMVLSWLAVIPLILACMWTMTYGFHYMVWVCVSPLLIWGCCLNRWSKRLRQTI